MGFSRKKKKFNSPVEDINGTFQGDRVKVVGIPGGKLKIEEKSWISRGQCKKWKTPGGGVTVNLTGNPKGQKPINILLEPRLNNMKTHSYR